METILKLKSAKDYRQVVASLTEEELEEAIDVAADSYYNESISLISDEIYDALVDRLKMLSPKSKILKQVGAPIKDRRVKLPYWMGSMNKLKTEKEIVEWQNRYLPPYLISDKLDGISCLLTVESGKAKLYTRGDGTYGQDVTHLLKYINVDISYLLGLDFSVTIRGEFIISKINFKKYQKIMSNARNMAGGIVNSKEETLNKKYAKDVDLITYEVIEPVLMPSEQMKLLRKWRMAVVYHDLYEDISLGILEGVLKKRKNLSEYEIDGIIVTENKRHRRNVAGNPPYSFAFKGATETANVKVIEVIWRSSKDGYLVPRIHFQKVRLSQADLEYATGFNAKFIVDNGIGPGAVITVVRSGDVIPYVLGVIKPAKKSGLPEDVNYAWDENGVNIILEDYEKDREVVIRRLTKFMNEIGVENVSVGIVTNLVQSGYNTIFKVINMTEDDFLSLPGFQERLARKIYNNLRKALGSLNILTMMVASNIFGRGFGSKKIKKILDHYPDIVQQYQMEKRDKWEERLLQLEGFDTVTVDRFLDYLPEFQSFYKKIRKTLPIKKYSPKKEKGDFFKGQIIVFTRFRNDKWKEFIEENGGKVTGSVSRNTTLVVYNDGETTSKKYLTAIKLGIPVMAKSEFEAKYFS